MNEDIALRYQNRSQRANRGSRMASLMRNDLSELEEDEFWAKGGVGSELFKEDTADREFVDKEKQEDVIDSDFDDSEEEDKETAVEEEILVREKRKVRPNVYQDPARKKPKLEKKLKTTPKKSASKTPQSKSIKTPESKLTKTPELKKGSIRVERKELKVVIQRLKSPPKPEHGDTKHTLRNSTVQNTVKINEKLEREEMEQRKRKKKKPKPLKKVTQEDRLREVEMTEMMNKESLMELLKFEEEQKKITKVKYEITGPVISYHSKNGINTMTFTTLPDTFQGEASTYPDPLICAITGKPAKYMDPLTQKPYANLEAFRKLRATVDAVL